jgi:hypothetical protein
MVRRFIASSIFLAVLIGLHLTAAPVSAQTGPLNSDNVNEQSSASAALYSLETGSFPEISAFLDVADQQNQFVKGLSTSQVSIIEDGQVISIKELELINAGAQFVLAINPGHTFAIRNSNGLSRYDIAAGVILSWAEQHQEEQDDDLSLLINGGPQIIHSTGAADWTEAFQAYQQDFRQVEPDLDILALAVEIASEPTPRQGMGRAVLFVSPPLEDHYAIGLQTLAARARQQGIRVFVWLIASPEYYAERGPGLLGELASQTGGELVFFSGSETLPSLERYIEPLQFVYRLVYRSAISFSGEHQVTAQVNLRGSTIVSAAQDFFVDVRAPNPIFVSPPKEITRTGRPPGLSGDLNLEPDFQELELLVEYPDGYPRQLMASLLFVDGALVSEYTEPPYDRLVWDLTPYLESNTYMLQVQVVDSLGLIGETVEIPVQVTVIIPRESIFIRLARLGPVFAGVAVALSAAILLLVMVLGGRIRPGMMVLTARGKGKKLLKNKTRYPRTFSKEPLTQPVGGLEQVEGRTAKTQTSRPHWINRLHWPHRQTSAQAYAYLTRLTDNDDDQLQTTLQPLTTDDVLIGSDSLKATLILDDPSLDGLHAHMVREGSTYRLSDEDSVAGTWVNYTPVSGEGTLLEHGDIIHIGRVGFRYSLRHPEKLRRPTVKWKEPPS